MYVVSWGENIAVVQPDGQVVEASSEAAAAEVRAALAGPILDWLPGDRNVLFQPGDPGHVDAGLRGLPGARVSGP